MQHPRLTAYTHLIRICFLCFLVSFAAMNSSCSSGEKQAETKVAAKKDTKKKADSKKAGNKKKDAKKKPKKPTQKQIDAAIAKVKEKPSEETHHHLGRLYAKQGKHAKAVAEYNKGMALSPNSMKLNTGLCLAYTHLKQFDKAEAACQKAIEITPASKQAKTNYNWMKKKRKAAQNTKSAKTTPK